MANIMNIPAMFITFFGGTGMVYALWTPASQMLDSLSGAEYVLCMSAWVVICFLAIGFGSFQMLAQDE